MQIFLKIFNYVLNKTLSNKYEIVNKKYEKNVRKYLQN